MLGAFFYKKLSLSKGVVFGCFAEEMAISSNHYEKRDWFEVNSSNIEVVAKMFDEVGITVPPPQCFGKPII